MTKTGTETASRLLVARSDGRGRTDQAGEARLAKREIPNPKHQITNNAEVGIRLPQPLTRLRNDDKWLIAVS